MLDAGYSESTGCRRKTLEDVPIDDSWTKLLPENSSIQSIVERFSSAWARSLCVTAEMAPSKEVRKYFLKLAEGKIGLQIVEGEYESMTVLHATCKDFTPKPIGFGTLTGSDCHFFLAEFIDLVDELPDVTMLGKQMADLHAQSITRSPNGKFGFHVTTFNGSVPQIVAWTDTWEDFFAQNLRNEFALDREVHGPSEEIERLIPPLFEMVIPRLLKPLESEGRILKPCIVHGDFWHGNVAVEAKSRKPYTFDAGCFWGHNEYDLCMARGAPRFKLGELYIQEYFRHFPISPPEEDWEDRNVLYALRADLQCSIMYPAKDYRKLVVTLMKQLVQKYGHVKPNQETESEQLTNRA